MYEYVYLNVYVYVKGNTDNVTAMTAPLTTHGLTVTVAMAVRQPEYLNLPQPTC